MAEAKTSVHDFNWAIQGDLTVTGSASISAFVLTQTLGGTDVTAKWSTAGTPALTTGMSYVTFTAGASTFRIPCWPTT